MSQSRFFITVTIILLAGTLALFAFIAYILANPFPSTADLTPTATLLPVGYVVEDHPTETPTFTLTATQLPTETPTETNTATNTAAPVVIQATQVQQPVQATETAIGVQVVERTPLPLQPTAAPEQPPAVPPTAAPTPVPPTTVAVQPTAIPATPVPPTAAPVVVDGSYTGFGSAPQPGPSPTWEVPVIHTPYPVGGRSKLGLHITGPGGGVEFAQAAQPAVMKAVNEFGMLKTIKEVSPNTITIARIYEAYQGPIAQGDARAAARAYVDRHLPTYQAHAGFVDYWEGWNEVAPFGAELQWYGEFEAERACYMQQLGFKALIGNFATGVPTDVQEFSLFLPAIEAGMRCGAVLGLHEYGAPTMYQWWMQGFPGEPWYPDRGPLIGRYRHWYNGLLLPRGLGIPLIITETGVDGLVSPGIRPGPTWGGWKEFEGFWAGNGLTDGTNAEQFYMDQLKWYDSILRQDPYVLGATIYTISGNCCGAEQWSYDAQRLLDELTLHIQTQQ